MFALPVMELYLCQIYQSIESALYIADAQNLSAEHWMFSQEALQEYLLICCQHSRGGLIDKPGKWVAYNQNDNGWIVNANAGWGY